MKFDRTEKVPECTTTYVVSTVNLTFYFSMKHDIFGSKFHDYISKSDILAKYLTIYSKQSDTKAWVVNTKQAFFEAISELSPLAVHVSPILFNANHKREIDKEDLKVIYILLTSFESVTYSVFIIGLYPSSPIFYITFVHKQGPFDGFQPASEVT